MLYSQIISGISSLIWHSFTLLYTPDAVKPRSCGRGLCAVVGILTLNRILFYQTRLGDALQYRARFFLKALNPSSITRFFIELDLTKILSNIKCRHCPPKISVLRMHEALDTQSRV